MASTLRCEVAADGIATITFDDPAAKVNTMTEAWQADLAEAVGMLERDRERIRGVLLASAKSTFFAGAELKSVLRMKAEDAPEAFRRVEAMKKVFPSRDDAGHPSRKGEL